MPFAIATLPSTLFSSACSAGSFVALQSFLDHRIDRAVDAADEEAGHAGNLAHITAARGQFLEARNVGFGDFLVDFLRKQQRDIDVDAFADQLLESPGCPRLVPGTLIITFGRATAFHSRRASSIVPWVSRAR